ncbi:MAG: MucB/RseB C-terminal domain-containing protein [Burkholderiales bacterium]|nr:MucB/RseB C-terminal domain-containing protein [Nitrosomonas sp.]MCP5273637.1 MucB/RseB C-terminal domain-containing protein [Burkholderiales bacterium]
MKNLTLPVLFFLFTFLIKVVNAESTPHSSESAAYGWLQKIAAAPRHLNFRGTFVYSANGHIETSKITHRVDLEGEHEKIEVLDGIARIVYRNNDEMKCYMPNSKKIYTEKRWFRKFFPDLLPQPSKRIKEYYTIETVTQERIAGYDSQVLRLMPKDSLRYGYKFWVHIDSGLLLKAAVIDKKDIIEQFAFTQIEIGDEIGTNLLDPALLKASQNWKTINLSTVVLVEGELAWQFGELPAGFEKVAEMKRNLVGKSMMVDHIVLSDELATVSVFVEPIKENSSSPIPGFYSSRGAINIYVRELRDNKITTVGEVPLNTIKLIGDAVFVQN